MGGGMGLFALGMLAAQAIRIVRNRAVARTLPVHDVRAHVPNLLLRGMGSSKHSIRVEPHLLASNLAGHDDDANSPTEAATFLSPRRGSSPLGPPLQSAPNQTVTSSNTLYAADARATKFVPDTDELPPDELAHAIAASLASSFPIDAVVQPTGRMTAEQRALAALDGVFESSDDEDAGTEIDDDANSQMYDRDANIGLSWSTASSSVDRAQSPKRGNSRSSRIQRSGSSLRAATSTAIEAGGARNVLVVPALGAPNGAMPRSPTPPSVVTAAPPLVITSTADVLHGPVPDGASRRASAVADPPTPEHEPGRRISSQFLAVPSNMSLSFPSSKSTTRSPSKASSIDEAATPSFEHLHHSHPIARGTRLGSTSTPTSPDTRTSPTPSTRQSSSRHILGTPAPSRTTLDGGAPAAAAMDVTAVAHAIAMESLRIDQASTRQQHRQRMLARRNSSTSTRSARAVARQRLTSQRVAQSTSQLDRTATTTARPSAPLGRGEPVAWSVDACNARIGRDGRPARQGATAGGPRAEPGEEVVVRPLQAKRRESREEKLARRSQWVMELMTYESVGV
ncbi:hypothetical protein AMAG_01419 [Allomyces macrogynus ATCC 38327]|uniref:Uncharacterized protein n=1 Tax=Allomyces macrogynus (strain ATCC 38327) TaxID=578462 RepID=A0A0L0RYW8_ALLM3|nr:hypothetical protein AMAG_01419 [Allomyces macrogynus ATCC 38327]|eukprot:KNE55533.1 hypothetical protein AMAG_01419 [Allomyces macrogynus ATCC 38327]